MPSQRLFNLIKEWEAEGKYWGGGGENASKAGSKLSQSIQLHQAPTKTLFKKYF